MNHPDWLALFGALTGLFGLIAGANGARWGYIAYRRSNQLKAVDLRLMLRKDTNATRAVLEGIPAIIDKAMASRSALAAAAGAFRSGAHQAWTKAADGDRIRLFALRENLPKDEDDLEALTLAQLESRIVELDRARHLALGIKERYLAELAEDDRQRAAAGSGPAPATR